MLFIYFDHPAFKELALEVQSGFQNSGYKAELTSEINSQNFLDLYVIFGMNNFLSPIVPKNYIVYQLEQTTGDEESKWFSETYLSYLKNALSVWDYSLVNYQRLKQLGIKNLVYVPILHLQNSFEVHHQELPDKDIDVLFVGSMNPRRQHIIDQLRAQNLIVEVRTNLWGDERKEVIARTKIMINIHYYEHAILETTRLAYLLTNRCLVISERSVDKLLDRDHKNYVAFVEYDGFVAACLDFLKLYHVDDKILKSPMGQHLKTLDKYFDDYALIHLSDKIPVVDIAGKYDYLLSKIDLSQDLAVPVKPDLNLVNPVTNSKDIFEAKTVITENHEMVLKLPKLNYSDLPYISLVTVTCNRRDIFPLAVRNYKLFEYPRDKIEWIIVDDSDDGTNLSDLVPRSKDVKYYKLKTTGRLSIGQKRNFGVEHATHEIIAFMDDDDYYYPLSLYARAAILETYPDYDLVGVTDLDIYDVPNEFSARINGAYISEASMAFRKSFWKERQFPIKASTLGEGHPFTINRRNRVIRMPSCFNLIALTHWTNYTENNRSHEKFKHVEKKSNILSILNLETRLFILKLFDQIKAKNGGKCPEPLSKLDSEIQSMKEILQI